MNRVGAVAAGWAVAAVATLAPARDAGARSPGARVAVMPFRGPDNPQQRRQFEKAAAEGLRATGADVVEADETDRKIVANGDDLKGCETPACLATVAQRAGAAYLVRGWVQTRGARNYKVHLEMVDGGAGAALGGEDFACEPCRAAEVAERINLTVSQMKVRFAGKLAGPAPAPVAAPAFPGVGGVGVAHGEGGLRGAPRAGADGPAATPANGSPDVGLAPPSSSATSPSFTGAPGGGGDRGRIEDARGMPILPWLAVTGGAVLIGGGAYLFTIDGDGTCKLMPPLRECPERYHTRVLALGLGVAGAALAAAGVYLIVRGPAHAPETAVAVGPGSLTLSGRF